ncbi:flavodoxin [Olsenella sp. DSM 107455]|uniref:Flavodoxin n=1 Tax=Thermophilibacter gallinarum TaxID=2779357 RepID=A0ABR9QRK6_9ACTN|nr:flavodoxin [Thermophilibacter gallinarum]
MAGKEKDVLTRRSFLTVAVGATSLFVAGCSGEKDEAPAADSATEQVEDASAADVSPAGNVLVAYFSATGNTEGVATAIAERLGADVFAIELSDPYTEADLNYNDDTSRTSVERVDGTNPELTQVMPNGWADYDRVLLGYPIWWGEAAWPLRTFVAGNDFAGKTVVPFCTSASSGIGDSADALAEIAGSGDWREGERFSSGAGDEAANWAADLGL